jgi:hypothetical protein
MYRVRVKMEPCFLFQTTVDREVYPIWPYRILVPAEDTLEVGDFTLQLIELLG